MAAAAARTAGQHPPLEAAAAAEVLVRSVARRQTVLARPVVVRMERQPEMTPLVFPAQVEHLRQTDLRLAVLLWGEARAGELDQTTVALRAVLAEAAFLEAAAAEVAAVVP